MKQISMHSSCNYHE